MRRANTDGKKEKKRKERMDEEEKRVSKYRLGNVVVGNEGEALGTELITAAAVRAAWQGRLRRYA